MIIPISPSSQVFAFKAGFIRRTEGINIAVLCYTCHEKITAKWKMIFLRQICIFKFVWPPKESAKNFVCKSVLFSPHQKPRRIVMIRLFLLHVFRSQYPPQNPFVHHQSSITRRHHNGLPVHRRLNARKCLYPCLLSRSAPQR